MFALTDNALCSNSKSKLFIAYHIIFQISGTIDKVRRWVRDGRDLNVKWLSLITIAK